MSDLSKTFSNFFGPMIDEHDTITLGNRILEDLEDLGYDFHEQRQILRGEMSAELPETLTFDISRHQAAEAKQDDKKTKREQIKAEREQQHNNMVANAYVKKVSSERLGNLDITLLIGFGFGEDTGHVGVGGETELCGWRFVEGLTPQQIAERTGTHESNWRNKAASGQVPAIKVGKQWILPAYLIGDEDYLQVICAESQFDDQADIEEKPL